MKTLPSRNLGNSDFSEAAMMRSDTQDKGQMTGKARRLCEGTEEESSPSTVGEQRKRDRVVKDRKQKREREVEAD